MDDGRWSSVGLRLVFTNFFCVFEGVFLSSIGRFTIRKLNGYCTRTNDDNNTVISDSADVHPSDIRGTLQHGQRRRLLAAYIWV